MKKRFKKSRRKSLTKRMDSYRMSRGGIRL